MSPDPTKMVDRLWEAARGRLPIPSHEEQRAGIVLLRQLARGEVVTAAQFARALGTSVETTETLLKNSALSPLIDADEAGRVQGFFGLSVVPTSHDLTVEGRQLWTWCAVDTLFIPELLGVRAEVSSRDPETGQMVRITVSAAGIDAADPSGALVSMNDPRTWEVTSATRIITSACHYIFFFGSRAAGERWQTKHPETILLTLDEAFMFGRRQNAHLFGAELGHLHAVSP